MGEMKKRGIVRWGSGLPISFFVVALGACNLILDNEPGKLAEDDGAQVGGDGDGDSDGSGGMDGTGGGSGEDCDCDEEETCQNGECYPWECAPGDDFCSGNQVRSCAEDGLSSTVEESCGDNQYCDAPSAECRDGVCEPDEPACDGNSATWCNMAGTGYEPGGTPCGGSASCDAGECEPHVCAPGEGFCQGQQVRECAENGLSSTVEETCDQVCLESGGSPSCVDCQPSATQCSGNGVQTCSASGQWGTAMACETNRTCVSGACTGVCGPGQTQCSGNGVQTCNASGQWGAAMACETNRTCVSGACTGVCGPGQTQSCGNCNGGTQTCTASGAWGTCTGQPAMVTYYRDADNDGYGNPNVTTQSCSGAPTGYVANNTDCCDTDANARPGQTNYFGEQRSGHGTANCNIGPSFDYNCNGSSEIRRPDLHSNPSCAGSAVGCSTTPFTSMGWVSTVPPCGSLGSWRQCISSTCVVGNITVQQECH